MATLDVKTDSATRTTLKTWRMALLFALPIVALVSYLFYTWFGVANRHLIFLYYHDMGNPRFDTTPFGWVTTSRYWMSGLVAAGAVMLPYAALHFTLGRVFKSFHGPPWWRVWVLCAVPLLVIIPAIVMTVDEPVLPLVNAAQVTAATLAGLALAVMPGRMAARHPGRTLLLAVDGLALTCLIIALVSFEDYPRWLARGSLSIVSRHMAVLAAGLVLVAVTTAFYRWRRVGVPGAKTWFAAGLGVTYLFFPLYHHLCWCKDDGSWLDPDYFGYIPDADNYFASSPLFQIGVWIGIALLVAGITRLRRRWSRHPGHRSPTAGRDPRLA